MARAQGSAFQTVELDRFASEAPVYETPQQKLAQNHNWTWANWSPTICSQRTPGDASEQYRTLASGTGQTDVFALRVPMVMGRTTIAAHPRIQCANDMSSSAASVFGMRSANAATYSWYSATGSSGHWRTYYESEWSCSCVATCDIQASSGYDVVTFGMQADDGSGDVDMRHLEVHWHPNSGNLASGDLFTGFRATDDAQWDDNHPNSCGLYSESGAGLAALQGAMYWPVYTFMDGLRDTKVALNVTSTDYETVIGPIPIIARKGENISSVGYSLLATRYGGTGTDNKIEVSLQTGSVYSENAIDSNVHTAGATFAAAPARPWESGSAWADDELDTGGKTSFLFVRMRGDGTYATQLHSLSVWAKGRG